MVPENVHFNKFPDEKDDASPEAALGELLV